MVVAVAVVIVVVVVKQTQRNAQPDAHHCEESEGKNWSERKN